MEKIELIQSELQKDQANFYLDGAALEEALARSLGLDDYNYIMGMFAKVDESIDQNFQRRFNHFYKVRRNKEWRYKFYQIFEESKVNKSIPLRTFFEAFMKSMVHLKHHSQVKCMQLLICASNMDSRVCSIVA